jgi:arsenate reductase
MFMKKIKVLFLCTGNSARSQMAEGLLCLHGRGQFDVHSAGLDPKAIHPFTIQVMNEIGCDMSGHTSKSLSLFIGKENFDFLVTVCDHANESCPVFPGVGSRLHWGFEDPAAYLGSDDDKLKIFRQIRDAIDIKILDWMTEMGFNANA